MPKIIESVREKILKETEKQVMESGYSAMTIRSVASACGIATGTVYNYFKSKEQMLAEVMSKDWHKCVEGLNKYANSATSPEQLIRGFIQGIESFSETYRNLFLDPEAQKEFAAVYSSRHVFLIRQIASIIEPACKRLSQNYSEALPKLISELIVIFVTSEDDLNEFIKLSVKLFN